MIDQFIKKSEEEFEKLCKGSWGGDTFITYEETWDGENEGVEETVNVEKLKQFYSHKLKQAYDLGRKKTSLKEWKGLANSARETFSKEELEKYGY